MSRLLATQLRWGRLLKEGAPYSPRPGQEWARSSTVGPEAAEPPPPKMPGSDAVPDKGWKKRFKTFARRAGRTGLGMATLLGLGAGGYALLSSPTRPPAPGGGYAVAPEPRPPQPGAKRIPQYGYPPAQTPVPR